MSEREMLNKGEIITIVGLLALDGKATTKELSDTLKISRRYISNITAALRKKEIIMSFGASEIETGIALGSPILNESIGKKLVGPKEKLHLLTIDFFELLRKHPEILEWAKSTLKINSPEELKQHLKRLKKERLKSN